MDREGGPLSPFTFQRLALAHTRTSGMSRVLEAAFAELSWHALPSHRLGRAASAISWVRKSRDRPPVSPSLAPAGARRPRVRVRLAPVFFSGNVFQDKSGTAAPAPPNFRLSRKNGARMGGSIVLPIHSFAHSSPRILNHPVPLPFRSLPALKPYLRKYALVLLSLLGVLPVGVLPYNRSADSKQAA